MAKIASTAMFSLVEYQASQLDMPEMENEVIEYNIDCF